MCIPAMALIGLAGTAVSAMGTMQQAQGAANQMAHNAAVAQINANTARQQGQSEAERVNAKHDKVRAQMRAAYARGGVDPFTGSADQILGEAAENSATDEWNTIWNRQTEAIGFENKKKDLEAQAKNTARAGNVSAGASFLTGLSRSGIGGPGSPLRIG
jgi:hypothetical protein